MVCHHSDFQILEKNVTAMTTNDDNSEYLNINSGLYKTRLSNSFKKSYRIADPKLILSFIPGTIVDILVKVGQDVIKGEDLMILDAMKMKNRLKSSMNGRVKSIAVKVGTRVPKGVVLIELE
jgi:biotin carboxyl carrier protein